ncbi:MAG: CsbD family protein [Vicinamibacterales bacterium]
MWNKNERDGKIDQAKGRAKQAVGDLTGDEKIKAEGEMDEAGGKVEEAVGKVQRKTVAAIEKTKDAVKR